MTDIDALVRQLTREEKAALCVGAGPWTTLPIPRLGIPALVVSDGPHGVRRLQNLGALASPSYPATCFPSASALASAWDVGLLREVGQALGRECLALTVDVLLGPGVNLKRSPLGGRNFEYYSEDPHLAGELAAAFIAGVQSMGVGTCLKHFAVNNQEFQRFSISALVDERALRELYLRPFEIAVRKARPWTVMCAYNRVNGTYCSEHRALLTEILKDEWGFEGLVVSDWGAVHDHAASLRAGLDLEMPGPKPVRVRAVIEAVEAGELDAASLDAAVRRILGAVFKAAATPKGQAFDAAAHHALARRAAAESVVLLKNDGLLPLNGPQHIAVIGRAAEMPHYQGGGSSHINPTRLDIPFTELQRLAPDAEFTYAEGYPADGAFQPALIEQAAGLARAADVALLYIALPGSKESEGYDRADLDLSQQQVALIQAVARAQPQTVVILNNGAPVAMSAWIDDVAAVLEAWMMGQAGGGAVADVLFGQVNPSGKLAETFPLQLVDTPAYLNWPGENGQVRYGEGLFVGYRYYDALDRPVLFPFGHGLSYTTFEYANPRVSAARLTDRESVTVSVDVTNTGPVAGQEVVQVYVHDQQSSLARPPKELKGFAKIALAPGETRTVTVELDSRAFAFYHPGHKRWLAEAGDFDILIGASSADIRHRLRVSLETTLSLPSLLNRESTLRQWLDDPYGKLAVEPMVRGLLAGLALTPSGDDAAPPALGMDPMTFMLDTPLLAILHLQDGALTTTPEDIVTQLLRQVHG